MFPSVAQLAQEKLAFWEPRVGYARQMKNVVQMFDQAEREAKQAKEARNIDNVSVEPY